MAEDACVQVWDACRNLNGRISLRKAKAEKSVPCTGDAGLCEHHIEQQEADEASVTAGGETLYYSTLEEAFVAANGKTATITMLENVECIKSDNGSPLNITGGNVTLDMNGKTLSGRGYGSNGIIDVRGGSLSVQGNGLFEVWIHGITCHDGTLIIAETGFKLTVQNTLFAKSGVYNCGGTVIINNGTFSGACARKVKTLPA